MATKITPTGLQATDRFLNIAISIETAGALRFGVVKVPLRWLLSEPITNAMDRAVRRQLIEAWSEVDLADPLF